MSDFSQQLIDAFHNWEVDDQKFDNGNNAAGVRARKYLQEMAGLIKQRRAEITEVKNSRKGT